MHHIISDGRSMEILSQEIISLYNAYLSNEKVPLSPLPVQYKEYAHWQNHQLRDNYFEPHQQYWWKQFEG
jgi:hypothetical protein